MMPFTYTMQMKQKIKKMMELQRTYQQTEMVPSKCVPDIPGTMALEDLECALDSVNDIMSDIDNFHLRNAFLYGSSQIVCLTYSVWKKSSAM